MNILLTSVQILIRLLCGTSYLSSNVIYDKEQHQPAGGEAETSNSYFKKKKTPRQRDDGRLCNLIHYDVLLCLIIFPGK